MRERGYFAPLMHLLSQQPDGAVFHLNRSGVDHYNRLQAENSYRWVFSRENDFEVVRQLIEQHPELSDPDRPRFSVHG